MADSIPSELSAILPEYAPKIAAYDVAEFEAALRTHSDPQNPTYVITWIDELHTYVRCIELMNHAISQEARPGIQWERPGIYRGHADCGWRLIPALMREAVFPETPDSTDVEALEEDLLTSFEKRALPMVPTRSMSSPRRCLSSAGRA